ncbi:uncharacterized protein LOC6557375 [Drosophila grimshawi]|uniref:GH16778 n=1 Tax=Drosophila grimshawi TaxID=7222 RepID=B4J3S3_DROGR|nr:uncharacterized protein LOC6557375 [Drosophila grimshawi]EDV97304.1 GH16778 [Drosophila grimshawi]
MFVLRFSTSNPLAASSSGISFNTGNENQISTVDDPFFAINTHCELDQGIIGFNTYDTVTSFVSLPSLLVRKNQIYSMKLFIGALSLCLVAFAAAQSLDAAVQDPSAEYLPPVGDAEAAALSDDGYRYKTVRRLKLRHRREVPSQEYLPPNQEYLPPVDGGEVAETKVADDGYRYKTVRKLKFRARHRRDVSEIAAPSSEYLPPVDVELAPELKTVLGADGYRYKTVRKLKFRRHRREADPAEDAAAAEATNGEYLPPAETPAAADTVEVKSADVPAEGTEVGKDGYRYKTVRRIRYRYRH